MKVYKYRPEYMNFYSEKFKFAVGIGKYNIGIVVHKGFIRFMLIWWHICVF